MANGAGRGRTTEGKGRQVVVVKSGKIEVTDQVEASLQKVKTLPDWLAQGPDAAAAYVEKELSGLSQEAKGAIKELAGAVAALRDRVATL